MMFDFSAKKTFCQIAQEMKGKVKTQLTRPGVDPGPLEQALSHVIVNSSQSTVVFDTDNLYSMNQAPDGVVSLRRLTGEPEVIKDPEAELKKNIYTVLERYGFKDAIKDLLSQETQGSAGGTPGTSTQPRYHDFHY